MSERAYLCIDLKSFYASVECVERGLDPLKTNLVVADPERTEKTICLAISPSMKELGIKNRCRLFEIPKNVEYIIAPPRMKLYIDYSANIYAIYLKYIAKEDIHVYSIDEAFLDVTNYLKMYELTAKQLGIKIMEDVFNYTKITATCGIGTNLYLTKIALDITAKHAQDHIGYLDEELYKKTLWSYKPLTDFWRIGSGTANRLKSIGILTMKDIANTDEEIFYKMFGIDAELLIDHAWGRESTTMTDIKSYTPKNNSVSSGQVLAREYNYKECLIVVKEMTDALCLDIFDKCLVTKSITLTIGYSKEVQKSSDRGTISTPTYTNSAHLMIPYVTKLYEKIVDKRYPIRRLSICFNSVVSQVYQQYDFFTDPEEVERDRRLQEAELKIKKKYGKNAIVKGMSLQKAGTAIERNKQIGGHKSGE